ncbi:MAG: hydrogenase expression/formation protein HypE, partial [Clostridiales bacterium]|nr:hydrogenase expression/formation protein HypE [Clostridiales bacterium]
MKITSAHGSGGKMTSDLIHEIFEKHFSNHILNEMEDAAVLSLTTNRIAFTTDSFVVNPVFFPGGDIGRLCICGTVNDLLMRGAVPKYLSAGFILEEGLETEKLEKIALSMKEAANEAGVSIVAGDTKVIEGKGSVYINTSGIGLLNENRDISAKRTSEGDAVIISGYMGNHHACILSSRMGIENSIQSDCAPLNDIVNRLLQNDIDVHAMRDVTRGGLATVLNEIASASCTRIELSDTELADEQVTSFCNILGLDPLYMGNEGKLVLTVEKKDAQKTLELMKTSNYGQNAQIIG